MFTGVKYVSENEVIVEFDNRPDFTVRTDDGTALRVANQLLAPPNFETFGQWVNYDEDEDTQVIDLTYLEEVA